ncbi:MAG: hypothetical protein JSW20_07215 [Nitrospiraceae bacterium]|nr:MAG: hypothetical protein JSW20_07215 [Nitrospiraceae bacterium]
MIKKILVVSVLMLLLFQGAASAMGTQGETIFRDALYGAAIGGLLGSAFYLLDDNELGKKVASGVIVGTIGGLVFGFAETTGVVQIENNKIKFAVPAPVINIQKDEMIYSASLIKAKF